MPQPNLEKATAEAAAAEKKSILFVDPETAVLDGLKRSLFRMRDRWDMHFSDDYAAAMSTLESGRFDLIVADVAVSGGNGLDFIRQVSARWPHLIRIALTGDVASETAMESLGVTHQFLRKPADIDTITTAVNRATRIKMLLGKQRVEDVIGNLQRVPSMPDAYRQLTRIIDDPDSDLKDAAAVIEMDPGLSSGILRIVNSAYFGLQRDIASIGDALNFIGIDTLKGLVLQDKLFKSIDIDPGCEQTVAELMRHGLECGSYARKIAAKLGLPRDVQADLYMTGLIHDFGRLLMLSACGPAYLDVLENAGDDTHACQLETEQFGAHHAAIAAYLFGVWGFAEKTVDLIARQHQVDTWQSAEGLDEAVMFAAFEHTDAAGPSAGAEEHCAPDNPHHAKVAQILNEMA